MTDIKSILPPGAPSGNPSPIQGYAMQALWNTISQVMANFLSSPAPSPAPAPIVIQGPSSPLKVEMPGTQQLNEIISFLKDKIADWSGLSFGLKMSVAAAVFTAFHGVYKAKSVWNKVMEKKDTDGKFNNFITIYMNGGNTSVTQEPPPAIKGYPVESLLRNSLNIETIDTQHMLATFQNRNKTAASTTSRDA